MITFENFFRKEVGGPEEGEAEFEFGEVGVASGESGFAICR